MLNTLQCEAKALNKVNRIKHKYYSQDTQKNRLYFLKYFYYINYFYNSLESPFWQISHWSVKNWNT